MSGPVLSPPRLTPERRQRLLAELADRRRVLEEIRREIEETSDLSFDRMIRPQVVRIFRDMRAGATALWHRANAIAGWTASIEGPLLIQKISPLIQAAMVEAMDVLEVQSLFGVTEGLIEGLNDERFTDGTALEIRLQPGGELGLPLGHLAFALVPTDRHLTLLGAWLTGREGPGGEWPQATRVRTKIGPILADRWSRPDHAQFLQGVIMEFRRAVSAEVQGRVRAG